MLKITEIEFEILSTISKKGITSKVIREKLEMDQANCSRRLNKLAKLGFIFKKKQGREIVWFEISDQPEFRVSVKKPKIPMYEEKEDTYIPEKQTQLELEAVSKLDMKVIEQHFKTNDLTEDKSFINDKLFNFDHLMSKILNNPLPSAKYLKEVLDRKKKATGGKAQDRKRIENIILHVLQLQQSLLAN